MIMMLLWSAGALSYDWMAWSAHMLGEVKFVACGDFGFACACGGGRGQLVSSKWFFYLYLCLLPFVILAAAVFVAARMKTQQSFKILLQQQHYKQNTNKHYDKLHMIMIIGCQEFLLKCSKSPIEFVQCKMIKTCIYCTFCIMRVSFKAK